MIKNFKFFLKMSMIVSVLVCFFSACGGKYDDVIKVNEEFVEIIEQYADTLQKADNAKDVAAAINDVAEKMEKLAPRMKELQGKYPDLRADTDLPEKLQKSQQDMEKVGEKLAGSFMTLAKYVGDSEVMEAQMRLSKAMQSASM